ncbi:MAG: YbhB YbcL family protein [Gemmatimonadetes bacterium]|nr:YbhB YbcL family protein [Gemmatimonadota bacterium]
MQSGARLLQTSGISISEQDEPMSTTASEGDRISIRAPQPPKMGNTIAVKSQSIAEGAPIGMEHVFTGCGGKNVSPQLTWSGHPAEAKSFAISCFDPDAPTGSGYWHWLAFDIPGSVTSLEAGAGNDDSPAGGKSGYTDYGMTEYGGPCPPKGDPAHRYIFTVYALDVEKIEGASKKTTGATLVFMMRGHVLATGTITARFGH